MAKQAVVKHEEEDLRRRVASRALRQFRVKRPPVVSCHECLMGFGHRKDRDRHICQPEITKAKRCGSAPSSEEGVERRGGDMGNVGLLADQSSVVDSKEGEIGMITSEDDVESTDSTSSSMPKKSLYQRLLGFYKRSRARGLKEVNIQNGERQQRREAWEEVKRQNIYDDNDDNLSHTAPADHTILQTLHGDNIEQGDDPTREKDDVQKGGLLSRIFETFSSSAASKPSVDSGSKGLPSEKEQTQVMSEIISQLQMIKTRLLMTYSHAGGRNIDRELRKIDIRATVTHLFIYLFVICV